MQKKKAIIKRESPAETNIALDSLTGWDTLPVDQRDAVTHETASMFSAFKRAGDSMLEVAAHLKEVRKILLPAKMYEQYLTQVSISRQTANRWLNNYEMATETLRPKVLEAATLKGVLLTPKRLKRFPPPTDDKPEHISKWIEAVKNPSAKGTVTVISPAGGNPEQLLAESFRVYQSRFAKLPNNSKTKGNFVRQFCGMTLTLAGIATSQTIEPVAIPDSCKPLPRGRPKLDKKQA